jgi:hypothetical protein
MISITNPKVAGFVPRWAPFRSCLLLTKKTFLALKSRKPPASAVEMNWPHA